MSTWAGDFRPRSRSFLPCFLDWWNRRFDMSADVCCKQRRSEKRLTRSRRTEGTEEAE